MTKSLVAAVVVAATAAAGGGYAWALHEGQAEISQAAAQIRAGLGADGSFSYASAAVHPFQKSADLFQVALRTASGELVTADRVSVVSGGSGKIASMHVDQFRVSAAAEYGSMTIASVDAKAISFPAPAAGQPLIIDPAAVTIADLGFRDLSFTGPGNSAKAAAISVHDYGAGRPSTIRLQDFSAPVPNAELMDHAGFASFNISGIDLATAVHAVEHHSQMPQLSAGAVHLEMEGLYSTNGSDRPVVIQKAFISGSPEPDGVSSVNIQLSGISFTPTDAATKANFSNLGLTKLNGSLSMPISYRIAGGAFEMSPTIYVEGFGKLAVGLKLAHLDASALAEETPNLMTLLVMASATQVVSAYADFTDGGLRDFQLANQAKKVGLTKDQICAQVVDEISRDPVFTYLPNGEQARATVVSFVRHGGSIKVTVQPQSPMSVMELIQGGQAPFELFSQLGLSVTSR